MSERTVVVVGSGGREHALARRLAEDPAPARVVVIPGNDGIGREFERRPGDERDVDGVVLACRRESADLVVVGPEAPLALGLADRLAAAGIAVFGPSAAAARLESSKWFAKQVLRDAGVATADAERFDSLEAAIAALDPFGPPWVLKADGLAGGKGVLVTSDRPEAVTFARECLDGARFGEAGGTLLLERFLSGEEVSVMAVCDGARAVLLPAARDFKRAEDGDRGPNTGGMGAFAPSPSLDPATAAHVHDSIVLPVLNAMAARGTPFQGVLYCGLMLTAAGPSVVEFNVRFGDPETQVILPRVGGSLVDLLERAALGSLGAAPVERRPGATVAVALVDAAYPAVARGDGRLTATERVAEVPGAWLLYSAVRAESDGWRITGGRAAYACAEADTLDGARRRAYEVVARLGGAGWRFRRDIATMESVARDTT